MINPEDDPEIMEQLRRSRNAPSRDFEEVAEELGIPQKKENTNKFCVIRRISRCGKCPFIKHRSFISKFPKEPRKPIFRAVKEYHCGENGQMLADLKTIPDTCPRLEKNRKKKKVE